MSEREKLKDLGVRAGKTFLQSFLGVFLFGLPLVIQHYHVEGIDGGKAAIVALVSASLAAGISAVQSSWKHWVKDLLQG